MCASLCVWGGGGEGELYACNMCGVCVPGEGRRSIADGRGGGRENLLLCVSLSLNSLMFSQWGNETCVTLDMFGGGGQRPTIRIWTPGSGSSGRRYSCCCPVRQGCHRYVSRTCRSPTALTAPTSSPRCWGRCPHKVSWWLVVTQRFESRGISRVSRVS